MKILFFLLIPFSIFSQNSNLDDRLFNAYETFKEAEITHKRFQHKDIQKLINKIKNHPKFRVEVLGKSIEGREISMIYLC